MNKWQEIIEGFAGLKVVVIGDCMTDVYHWGRVDRLSPEAPVPVFLENGTEARPGGASNVANQLQRLGVATCHVWATGSRTEKHRYFAGHHQVFRIDRDVIYKPTKDDIELVKKIPVTQKVDAIVISDYAKGFVTQEICEAAIGTGIPVVVDPKGTDWSKYQWADVVCPNEKEYREHDPKTFIPVNLIVKKGDRGMDVIEGDRTTHIPARTHLVYDVTGAGDVVVALVAACVGLRRSLVEGASLASLAAGEVVTKLGTAVCTKEELLKAAESLKED